MKQTTLHTLNKGYTSPALLQACLRGMMPGDSLLLLEDAVYLTAGEHPDPLLVQAAEAGIDLFVLQEDMLARGLATASPLIRTVDYGGFVALSCACSKTVSWF